MPDLLELNLDNWEQEVLLNPKMVIVDFRALWCPLLISQIKMLEEIAIDLEEYLRVGSLDVPRIARIALIHQVKDLPVTAIFYEGRILKSFSGKYRIQSMKEYLLQLNMSSPPQKCG